MMLKFMNKQQAICVIDEGTVVGVLLFSRKKNVSALREIRCIVDEMKNMNDKDSVVFYV